MKKDEVSVMALMETLQICVTIQIVPDSGMGITDGHR